MDSPTAALLTRPGNQHTRSKADLEKATHMRALSAGWHPRFSRGGHTARHRRHQRARHALLKHHGTGAHLRFYTASLQFLTSAGLVIARSLQATLRICSVTVKIQIQGSVALNTSGDS